MRKWEFFSMRAHYVKIGVLGFVALLDSFGYSLLLNILPSLVDRTDPLHYTGVEVLSASSAYSLSLFTFVSGATLFPLLLRKLSDMIGPRLLILGALLCLFFNSLIQSFNHLFWVFAALRFFAGASGCLRPLAIAYIADLITEETARGWFLWFRSFFSAIAVGFGPLIGSIMAESDRSYPSRFMAGGCGACFILALFFVPNVKHTVKSSPSVALSRGEPSRRVSGITVSLLILGFSTYFMTMMASTAFPLSFKESFGMSPVIASLYSIIDGPLILLANFFFMHNLTSILSACKASIIASLIFCLIALVPVATDNDSLVLFLMVRYSASLASPILFSALPQIMINSCPQEVCGRLTEWLTLLHGSGRMTASVAVGSLFAFDPEIVYNTVAVVGLISSFVFVLLLKDIQLLTANKRSNNNLKSPLLLHEPLDGQLSALYSGTPTVEIFPLDPDGFYSR